MMAYYNYSYLNENGVGIGWLDTTDRIKNTTALAFSKNITEYWVQEISNFDLKTYCDKSVDNILKWAAINSLNYLLVIAVGNNLSKKYNFIQELPEFLEKNKNFSIIGHILDKGDRYYELHHQAFLVNVKWWRNAGMPKVGEENSTVWSTVEPTRSQENWHDGYTPHWISAGTNQRTYTGKRFGWNIIETALKTSDKIYSFDEKQRESKYYLYPEVAEDTYSKFYDVFNALQSYTHFVANTETPPDKIQDINFSGAICTAGGITPLLTAWSAGLKPHDKLIIIDISPLSLTVQRGLREIGSNFKNFKQDFFKILGPSNSTQLSPLFRADRNVDKMQKIINDLMLTSDLDSYIKDTWPHLHVEYVDYNIFNVSQFKHLLNIFDNNENVLIHLTNMLHYQNTAWIYDAESRYKIEKQLFDILAEQGMDRFYLYQNRPGVKVNWRMHTPRQILNNSDRYLSQVPQLSILPWKKK
jgi:hypothetical protein